MSFVTIRLQVVDAHVRVDLLDESTVSSCESVEGPNRHEYFIISDRVFERMIPDTAKPGVFTCRAVVGDACRDFFSICVDEDKKQKIYPTVWNAVPGEVAVVTLH